MPNSPRDTGLQVIHYAGVALTPATPFLATAGKLVADLPVGCVITDVDLNITAGFGVGSVLNIARTPGGPPIVAWTVDAVARKKLAAATIPLPVGSGAIGGPLYASITPAPVTGAMTLVVSFAPKLG